MRSTLNIKHTSPADLAKNLRSAAAKIEADQITPGADFTIGNVRVQVATPQIGTLRAWAVENGYPVGTRGVISNEVKQAYAAAVKQANRDKRAAAAARRAEKAAQAEAAAELVTA